LITGRFLVQYLQELSSDPHQTTTITTNSQCGSRFRRVWGNPVVGNLISTGIPTHREVDSIRPTKPFCEKKVYSKNDCKAIYRVKERGRERGSGYKIKRERRHTSTNQGRLVPSHPRKARPVDKHIKTLPAPHRLSYCHLRSQSPTIRDLIMSRHSLLS